jgi:3-methyladenine DNA glycosylase AlkD
MTKIELLTQIENHCINNSNPAIVDKYKRYFKEEYDSFGVSKEVNEVFIKTIFADNQIDINLIDDISKELLLSNKYEYTSIPLLLLLKNKKHFNNNTFQMISRWFDIGITNWAHTDYICSQIMDIFFKKNIISYQDLAEWRFSDRKFKRRAVPVSLLEIKKTHKNFQELFDFIEPMMMDKDRVVHQGIGWFLREVWKIEPAITEAFLLKWKDKSARLIFQYACEKMEKEYRVKFRRNK